MSECLNKLKKNKTLKAAKGIPPNQLNKGDEIKIKSGLQSQTATP